MRRPAFTLVEMLLVLGIVAASFWLVTPRAIRGYQVWEQQRFFKQLEQQWQAAAVHARVSQRASSVKVLFDSRQICFIWHSAHHMQRKDLAVPGSLTLVTPGKIGWKLQTDGYTTPGTIGFIDRQTGARYEVRIQMGGAYKFVQTTPGRLSDGQ